LQHALYRAAKADPGRRFHALYDKVSRRDVLQRAWEQVRRNRGAPGIDQLTIAQVEVIPTCLAEGEQPRYEPTTSLAHLQERFGATLPYLDEGLTP